MGADPLSGDVIALKGTDTFRRRVGHYRIVFSIDFKTRFVAMLDIRRRITTTYR